MNIVIPNLASRPDKLGASRAGFLIRKNSLENAYVFQSHDANNYADTSEIIQGMRDSGWVLGSWSFDDLPIIPSNIPEYGPCDFKKHLAFRWTYLDILNSMETDTMVMLDDQVLTVSLNVMERYGEILHEFRGDILGTDPIFPNHGLGGYIESFCSVPIVPGYSCPTEESIIFTVEGAKNLIPLILEYPMKVIGEVISDYYPKEKVFTSIVKLTENIGPKPAWKTDVHIVDYSDSDYHFKTMEI